MNSLAPLSPEAFKKLMEDGCTVLDCRTPEEINEGFIPNSLFISDEVVISDAFKTGFKQHEKAVAVGNGDSKALEILIGRGYQISGYLEGGVDAWADAGNPIDIIVCIEADEMKLDMKYDVPQVIDVRPRISFDKRHLKGADSVPAEALMLQFDELPEDITYYLYDDKGDIALFVITFLKRLGLHNFYLLKGGLEALAREQAEMEGEMKN